MKKFEIEVINYLEKDEPVAEIYFESLQCAEMFINNSNYQIKIYSHPKNDHWEFSMEELIKILKEAKTRLLISKSKSYLMEAESYVDPEAVNAQAKLILDEIINHPNKKTIYTELGRFGKVKDIYEPKGKGARFSLDGEFICFLE